MPKFNERIISQLNELYKLLSLRNKYETNREHLKSNSIRIKNCLFALKIIKKYNHDIYNITVLKKSIIDENTIDMILFIIDNPDIELPTITNLKRSIISYHIKTKHLIEQLTRIDGIDISTAIRFIKNYHIRSVTDLVNKINNGKIKVNNKIINGIKYYGQYTNNIPYNEITLIGTEIKDILYKFDKNIVMTICGPYRRHQHYSDDIDILIYHKKYKTYESVINAGLLKDIIIILLKNGILLKGGNGFSKTLYSGLCRYNNNPIRRIDLEVIGKCSYPVRLLQLTGSYVFIRYLKNILEARGLKLGEKNILDKNNKIICLSSEKHVFDYLDIDWIPPEQREAAYLYSHYLFKQSDLIKEIYLKKTLFELD